MTDRSRQSSLARSSPFQSATDGCAMAAACLLHPDPGGALNAVRSAPAAAWTNYLPPAAGGGILAGLTSRNCVEPPSPLLGASPAPWAGGPALGHAATSSAACPARHNLEMPPQGQRQARQPGGNQRRCRLAECRTQAVFEVIDCEQFSLRVQAEAALRHLASLYTTTGELAERDGPARRPRRRGQALRTDAEARFADAGVEVVDASSPTSPREIAQVMRRQQAKP